MPTPKTVLASLVIFAAIPVWAASPSIGFVAAKGSFQLDNSKIWSNATLFDGSVVETKAVPSQIHLSNGSDLQVAAESRVRVFQSRAVLEKGAVQLQSSDGYQVEARQLHLAAAASKTVAGVELRGNGTVAASATSGEMLITNKDKLLVAHVTPGKVVALDPGNASQPGLTRINGCVQRASHGVLLVDEASDVAFELHGEGVEKEVGNRVEITGAAESASPKVAGATQSIRAVHVDRVGVCLVAGSKARKAGAVGATAAGVGAAVGAAGGAVAGAVVGLAGAVGVAGAVAIIGGVTVATTAGALAATGAFDSAPADTPSATSR